MTQVANTYAQALYSLTREEGLEKQILEEMTVLQQAFDGEPAFVKLLSVPNLSKEERCAILDDSFRGKIHGYLLNFMKILTEKGYARHFADCCKAYKEQYNDDHGIITVTAVSAVALNQEQKDKLSVKLGRITGKTIELQNRVDPEVLGGIRLDYDGKRVDGTVQNRLESVRALLKNTVL